METPYPDGRDQHAAAIRRAAGRHAEPSVQRVRKDDAFMKPTTRATDNQIVTSLLTPHSCSGGRDSHTWYVGATAIPAEGTVLSDADLYGEDADAQALSV